MPRVQDWIAQLANGSQDARIQAARELFRMGCELAAPALARWGSEPELASLIAPGGQPTLTVGVAVSPADFERIRAANGMPQLAGVPPDLEAREFELQFPPARLDVITTTDPAGAGAIARYLARFDQGIQQVEISVNDVDRATMLIESRFGEQPVYPSSRAGANGTRVNFFLTAGLEGNKVLIELVNYP